MVRVVLLIALVVGCAGHAKQRGPAHVKGVEWLHALALETVGGEIIDPTDILPRLGLAAVVERGGTVDEYQLQLDQQRIAGAFQRLGYFDVTLKTRIDKPAKGDAATLVFVVTPGKRATTALELLGLPDDVPVAKVRKAIGIKDGSLFDYDDFDAAKEPLADLLQDSGYAHARLDGTVLADRGHARATLRFVVDPGPRSTFGEVVLVGVDDGMLGEAVRARIAFVAGQKYSHQAIVDTQNAIYGIGLFGTVRIEPQSQNVDPVVAMKITVTPVTKNEASAGFGFGLDPFTYSIRLRGTWTRHGVITPLTTSALDLRPEYALETATCKGWYQPWTCKRDFRGRAVETLTQQDLFLPNVKGDVEGGVDYLVYEAYAKLGAHVRLGLAAPILTKKLQLHVGWQYQVNDFPSIYVDDTLKPLGIHEVNYVGAYTGSLVLDLRDHAINTTSGLYAELRAVKGTRLALGSFEYLQLTPEVRGYLPVSKYVLAVRARLGTISGNVPATERYFGGGTSSMRGFGARQLSPFAPSSSDMTVNLPVGGAGLFETSLELRTPALGHVFGFGLTTVVFLDGGDVTFVASDLDLTQLHWATGVGLRIATPIGPIGIDVAYRLNRTAPASDNPDPDTHFNFLFAVGEAF